MEEHDAAQSNKPLMRVPGLKRIDTYIMAKFIGTYFFAIALIISVGVVFDYTEHVDNFTRSNAPWKAIIFQYYINFIPYYANLFSSLFVFLSVIFFTTKLASNSEIIAMVSTGMSLKRLMRPYLLSSVIIAALTLFLSSEVIPRGSVKRLAFENTYKNSKKNATYADNVQLQVDSGVIAYLEHFDGISKTGIHFSLDKFVDKKLVSHLTATTVIYDTLSDVRNQWRLQNVSIRDLSGYREEIKHFQTIDSIIKMEPSDFLTIKNQHETMTNRELKDYIERQRNRGVGNLMQFEVEYQRRFASPFSAFILSTIGLCLSSRKRKSGMGFSIGLGLLLSVTYIMLQTMSSMFSINGNMHPMVSAWIPNVLFSIVAFILYLKAPK